MARFIHRLALAALSVTAAQSIFLTLKPPFGSDFERVIQPLIAVTLWSFLCLKLRRRPQKWGFGIGVFLLAMVAFQTHLWIRAANDPDLLANGFEPSASAFVLWELPLAVAAVLCILLRWRSPADTTTESAVPGRAKQ
jgi:hypothetical protein